MNMIKIAKLQINERIIRIDPFCQVFYQKPFSFTLINLPVIHTITIIF